MGGLGFKKVKDINNALLAKLAWLIASKHDSLCMQILRARYKVKQDWLRSDPPKSASPIWKAIDIYYVTSEVDDKVVVGFTTKSISYSHKGNILEYMVGIDLSCNNLAGKIPPELSKISSYIRALNLSHNNLSRSIPVTFSNLKQIESLDLSYNNLNGRIPP